MTVRLWRQRRARIPFPFGDSVAMQISPVPSFSKRGIKNCARNFPFFKGDKGGFSRTYANVA
jgi:hypothetical protein